MTQLGAGSAFGAYRIEGVLGRGGMGVVYRATQVALDRVVALKVLAPELAGDEEFRARFQRESRLLASIDHPNVMPIFEAGELDGTLFLSMRYVQGVDLRDRLRLEQRLALPRALAIVEQVAAALDAAHSNGLVHRDVKPANILIERRADGEHVFLSDFGLTKHVGDPAGDLTKTGEWLGTVDYVAPEQVLNVPVDARADVYALGCVLYASLAGEPPFVREGQYATVFAHVNDPPPTLTDADPSLPQALDPVIQRALAKDRDARFPSAGDLARAARAAVDGEATADPERSVARGAAAIGSASRRPPPGQATRRSARPDAGRPRRTLAAIGALLAVVAITVAVVIGVSGGEGEGEGGDAAAPVSVAAPEVLPRPGGRPEAIASDGADVYVATDSGVARYDTADPSVPVVARVEGSPGSIAAGAEGVWALTKDGAFRLDEELEPVGRSADVGSRASVIAVGEGSLWVTSGESGGAVYRLDPDTGRRTGTVELPDTPRELAVGGGAVWVTVGSDRVVRIDPGAPAIAAEAEVTGFPSPIAIDAEHAWIGLTGESLVVPLDAASAEQTLSPAAIRAPTRSLAVGGGTVWAATASNGTVTRIDAATAEMVGAPIRVGGMPTGLVYAGDALWVIDRSGERVLRLPAG